MRESKTDKIHAEIRRTGTVKHSQLLRLAVEHLKGIRRATPSPCVTNGLCNSLYVVLSQLPLGYGLQAIDLRTTIVRKINRLLGPHAYLHSWLVDKGYASSDAFHKKAGRRDLLNLRIKWAISLAEEYERKGK